MRELLHPPGHRGPLIAAGAVVLPSASRSSRCASSRARACSSSSPARSPPALLWLGLQGRRGRAAAAYVSVLIVAGCWRSRRAAAAGRRARAARRARRRARRLDGLVVAARRGVRRAPAPLGDRGADRGARRRRSRCWPPGTGSSSPDGVTPYRWLLLLLAFVFGSRRCRCAGTSLRHAEQMVNAAGLAILAIPLLAVAPTLFFGPRRRCRASGSSSCSPAGLGLVAYAAADRAPGPAYLGVANLAAFVVLASATSDDAAVVAAAPARAAARRGARRPAAAHPAAARAGQLHEPGRPAARRSACTAIEVPPLPGAGAGGLRGRPRRRAPPHVRRRAARAAARRSWASRWPAGSGGPRSCCARRRRSRRSGQSGRFLRTSPLTALTYQALCQTTTRTGRCAPRPRRSSARARRRGGATARWPGRWRRSSATSPAAATRGRCCRPARSRAWTRCATPACGP